MTNPNKLVEASFYKKEGAMLWGMYLAFFMVGYFYGHDRQELMPAILLFVVVLIALLVFGKKQS